MASKSEEMEFVSQEKSLLKAEAFTGCSLGCGYCFRKEGEETIPKRKIDDEELVELLLQHKYFLRDRSPLSVNSDYIDPFLPQTKESTFRILEILAAEELKNLVSLITKSPLSENDIRRLESFHGLDIEVCVSYSEMPSTVEPIGNERRIETLYQLGQSRLKSLHFYRPIVVGFNDSEECIGQVLKVSKEAGIDAVMVGGLRLSDKLRRLFRARTGLPVPECRAPDRKKYLPQYLKETLFRTYEKVGLQIPMVRRTSCGRSVIRGIPDYNGHWIEPDKNCWPTCPTRQRKICADAIAPTVDDVAFLLDRIETNVGFELNLDKTVTFYSGFNRQDTNFLRQNLGVMIYTR